MKLASLLLIASISLPTLAGEKSSFLSRLWSLLPSSASKQKMTRAEEVNVLFDTDSYKVSQWAQNPKDVTKTHFYVEARGGKFQETVFFGLQPILEVLETPITKEMVEEARKFWAAHFRDDKIFNYKGWMRIVNVHNGRLPVRIKAPLEGTVVPLSNVLVTVESTDPELVWLPSWLETKLLRFWHPLNVATLSYHCKLVIKHYLDKTTDSELASILLPSRLHDFGSRGVSSAESAEFGGAGHLVNFEGTDTGVALRFLQRYYQADMAGFSIPAAEHSTITSWTKPFETEAYRNMLEQFATSSDSIVAVVSDSYDIENAVRNIWGGTLKQEVIDRNATLVIRPDSGDPKTGIMNLLAILAEKFGTVSAGKKNEKTGEDYKLIAHKVRLIQGDGVDLETIGEILACMDEAGYSAANIAFGMGGALLQKHNRDTQAMAMKLSWELKGGVATPIKKEAPGKKSKPGRLDLIASEAGILTHTLRDGTDPESKHEDSIMAVVFEDGRVTRRQSFEGVREKADEYFARSFERFAEAKQSL